MANTLVVCPDTLTQHTSIRLVAGSVGVHAKFVAINRFPNA